MKRQEKVELVQQYQAEFARRPNVFVAEYRGMTVEQITDLRVKLRKADGAMKVMKNTFLRRAVDGTDKARARRGLEGAERGHPREHRLRRARQGPHRDGQARSRPSSSRAAWSSARR